MTTVLVTHPDCLLHDMGAYHPESPRRLRAIEDGLRAAGVYDLLPRYEAPLATCEQIERVHSAGYVDWLHGNLPQQGLRRPSLHLWYSTYILPSDGGIRRLGAAANSARRPRQNQIIALSFAGKRSNRRRQDYFLFMVCVFRA